jgi:hypothetical protein
MTTQPWHKLNIVEIAMKKRKLKLYEKISRGDVVTRAELKELKKYEDGDTDPGILETWKDIHRVFGVSEMTVARWVKLGMPTRPDGKFNIVDIQSWRNTRDVSGKQKGKASNKKAGKDWEQEYRKHKALREERRNMLEAGELVTIKEIEEGLVRVSTAIKQTLLRLPHIFAVRLENKDQREILTESTDLINGVINMIAQERIFEQYSKKPKEKAKARKKKNAHA